MFDCLILTGEASGDLLGSSLISELLQQNPHLKIGAMAGPKMRKLPIEPLFRMEDLQVMGFIDVFFALPRIIRIFFKIRNAILKLEPKVVVCIDYPGFHLKLENSLRKKGFKGKLIHYVSPSVWAWKKGRIPLMEKNLDLLLTVFPFEKQLFSKKLQVEHIGHPLVSAIAKKEKVARGPILALFPGSRTAEIAKNLPIQIAVAKELQKMDPAIHICISISQEEKREQILSLSKDLSCTHVPPEKSYSLMQEARLALATSGTVTLELALHNTPTIVQYFIRPFECFLAERIFRINLPFYCIVNIVAGREIFPEFFGPNLTFQNLFTAAKNFWFAPEKRDTCEELCTHVRSLLTEKNASEEASALILLYLKKD